MTGASERRKRRKRRARAPEGTAAAGASASQPRLWVAAALVAITCLAYAPALEAPFQFDDLASITGNASIRSLWPVSVPLHPPPRAAVAGRPVVNYSFALNYALNEGLGIDQRPDPDGPRKTLGFHLANLLLHLASGALLFGILRRTLRGARLAQEWASSADAMAAMIVSVWLLHPIQTEAVNYVVQRTELLVSAFYLGTLYAAIRAWEAGTSRATTVWYAAAVTACLLGMGSKEVMVTAPFTVLLYDRAFRSGSWRESLSVRSGRLLFYIALAATSAWSIFHVLSGSRAGSVGFELGVSWYRYLYSQAWAIAHYLRLVFVPAGLTFDYGQDPVAGLRGVPGLILLGGLGIATLVAWTRAKPLGFIGAWFFVILAPSSSFVPIRTEIAAERRLYLPLISVVVLLAVGLTRLRRRMSEGAPRERRWWHTLARKDLRWAGAGLCLVLAVLTFQRSRLYADPEALWSDAVAKAPRNPRAYDHLAAALLRRRPPALREAEAALRQSIAIDSTYLPAWPDLAAVVAEQGRLGEARRILERAVASNPNDVRTVERLGNLLVVMGEPAAALPHLERVAAEAATDDDLLALGTAYTELGRPDDAAKVLRRALALNPARADVMSYLGSVLTDQGRAAEAVPILEEAARIDASSGFTWAALSVAYAEAGRTREAAAAASSAGASGSPDPTVFLLAARAMTRLGRPKEAEDFLYRALTLQPDFAPARRALERLKQRAPR